MVLVALTVFWFWAMLDNDASQQWSVEEALQHWIYKASTS